MSNPQNAEDIRNSLRSIVSSIRGDGVEKLLDSLPLSKVTLTDLISGPDELLGPNQIELREYVVNEVVKNECKHMSITLGKEADSKSFDELAKSALAFFLAPPVQDSDLDSQ